MAETRAADTARGEFRRGWPVVLATTLGLGLGVSPVPFYTLGALAPHLAAAFGWGFGQILFGATVATLVVIVASPVVGALSVRYGVRRVALISIVLFSLSFCGFAFSNGSLVLYYANWALMAALGAGTLPMTWTRAVNNRFETGKGLALGLSLAGTGLFGYLVKPYASWVIGAYGWRAAYLAVGVLPLLIALPVALVAFHDVTPGKREAAKEDAATTQAVASGLSLRQALADWRFWVIGLAFLPIAFTVGGVIPNLENILKFARFKPGAVVQLASYLGLFVIVGRAAGGWLVDRFWAPAVALVFLGIPAGACWVLGHGASGYDVTALAVGLIGIAAGLEYDMLAFLTARYFGMRSYSLIYGCLYGFFSLGAGLGPPIFGALFDRTHSYATPLSVAAGAMLLGAAMLLALGRYRTFAQPDGAEIIAQAERSLDVRVV